MESSFLLTIGIIVAAVAAVVCFILFFWLVSKSTQAQEDLSGSKWAKALDKMWLVYLFFFGGITLFIFFMKDSQHSILLREISSYLLVAILLIPILLKNKTLGK